VVPGSDVSQDCMVFSLVTVNLNPGCDFRVHDIIYYMLIGNCNPDFGYFDLFLDILIFLYGCTAVIRWSPAVPIPRCVHWLLMLLFLRKANVASLRVTSFVISLIFPPSGSSHTILVSESLSFCCQE
jgi:hypothetical protein